MLQKIRDKTQGWFATLIVTLVCISFVLWGIHYFFQGGTTTQNVAVVNGQGITQQQFMLTYRQAQQQQQVQAGSSYSNDPAYQSALKQTVLKQMIRQMVLTQALQKQGYAISQKAMDDFIVNVPAFQDNGVFSQARFNQALAGIMLTPPMFYDQLRSQLMMSQLGMGVGDTNFSLPVDIKAAVMLLDETRDVGFMILPLDNFVKQMQISPAQIQAYYKQHHADFKSPEMVQLQYIQLPANTNPQNATQYAAQADKLANLAYENPNSLVQAARTLKLPIQTTPYFAKDVQNGEGILSSSKVVAAAFSKDVLLSAYNSDVITLDDGSQVVVRIASHKASAPLALAQVQAYIQHILLKQNAQQKMQEVGSQLAAQLANGASGDALAQAQQIKWNEKTDVNRHQQNVPPRVLQSVFNLYVPKDRQHPTTTTILLPRGNLAVVAFYAVKYGNFAQANPQEINAFNNEIAIRYGKVDYVLYAESAAKRAKIKLLPQALSNTPNVP